MQPNQLTAVTFPWEPAKGLRHVWLFFAWVLLLSVPFWLLMATHVELLPKLPVSALSVVCPLVAAMWVARSAGIASTWRDALHWLLRTGGRRVPAAVAVGACLINPLIAVLAYGITKIGQPEMPPPALSGALMVRALVAYIAAVAEEAGWTALATWGLVPGYGAVCSGLIVGAVWAVWHWVPLAQRRSGCRMDCRVERRHPGAACHHVPSFIGGAWTVWWAAVFHTPVNGSFWNTWVFAPLTVMVACLIFIVVHRPSSRHD